MRKKNLSGSKSEEMQLLVIHWSRHDSRHRWKFLQAFHSKRRQFSLGYGRHKQQHYQSLHLQSNQEGSLFLVRSFGREGPEKKRDKKEEKVLILCVFNKPKDRMVGFP